MTVALYCREPTDAMAAGKSRPFQVALATRLGIAANEVILYVDKGHEFVSILALIKDVQEGRIHGVYSDELFFSGTEMLNYARLILAARQLTVPIKPAFDTRNIEIAELTRDVSRSITVAATGHTTAWRGEKIRAGQEKARRAGRRPGAPSGNRNRVNKRKQDDPKKIEQIISLLRQKVPYREIIKRVSFKLTIGTITNIKKRLPPGSLKPPGR